MVDRGKEGVRGEENRLEVKKKKETREWRRGAGYRKPPVCARWWVGGLERGHRKSATVEE